MSHMSKNPKNTTYSQLHVNLLSNEFIPIEELFNAK